MCMRLPLAFTIFFSGLPAVITLASHLKHDDQSRPCTLDGVEFSEALRRLKDAGADVVGFNCTRGPREILKLLENVIDAGIEVGRWIYQLSLRIVKKSRVHICLDETLKRVAGSNSEFYENKFSKHPQNSGYPSLYQ